MGIPYNAIPNPKPYEKGMPISLEFCYNTAAISLSTNSARLARRSMLFILGFLPFLPTTEPGSRLHHRIISLNIIYF